MQQQLAHMDRSPSMKTFKSRLPWLWTGAVAIASLLVLFVAVQESGSSARAAGIAIGSWFPSLITLLGTLIAVRQPKNRIAWLLFGIGFAVLVEFFSQLFLIAEPASTSLPSLAAVVGVHVALPSALYMFLLIAIIFPSGRFLSNRQALVAWPGAILLPILFLVTMFTKEIGPPLPSEELAWTVTNPFGFLPASWLELVTAFIVLVLIVMAIGGFFSLTIRYRHSSLVTRAQIRWMLLATLILGGGVVLVGVTNSSQTIAGALILQIAFVPIPLSITIAITRYKLFEIDRIISRTITYALVAALSAGVFVGLVVVVGSFLPSNNPLVVAGATLAVAALFNPFRQRIQHVVDRRFNRSSYQAEFVSEEFAAKLREPLSTQQITALWSETVEEAMQPQAAGVWLKET